MGLRKVFAYAMQCTLLLTLTSAIHCEVREVDGGWRENMVLRHGLAASDEWGIRSRTSSIGLFDRSERGMETWMKADVMDRDGREDRG